MGVVAPGAMESLLLPRGCHPPSRAGHGAPPPWPSCQLSASLPGWGSCRRIDGVGVRRSVQQLPEAPQVPAGGGNGQLIGHGPARAARAWRRSRPAGSALPMGTPGPRPRRSRPRARRLPRGAVTEAASTCAAAADAPSARFSSRLVPPGIPSATAGLALTGRSDLSSSPTAQRAWAPGGRPAAGRALSSYFVFVYCFILRDSPLRAAAS